MFSTVKQEDVTVLAQHALSGLACPWRAEFEYIGPGENIYTNTRSRIVFLKRNQIKY
jgi:hypothetical protein